MAWKALLVCLCFFGASFADSLHRYSALLHGKTFIAPNCCFLYFEYKFNIIPAQVGKDAR